MLLLYVFRGAFLVSLLFFDGLKFCLSGTQKTCNNVLYKISVKFLYQYNHALTRSILRYETKIRRMKRNFDAAHSYFSPYEMTISYRKKSTEMKPLARSSFISPRSLMTFSTGPGRTGVRRSVFSFIYRLVKLSSTTQGARVV